MTTVRLDPPRPLEVLAGLPMRFRMSPGALRALIDDAGASWPWPDVPADVPAGSPAAADELARLGLVDPVGEPYPDVRRALAALLAPEVLVELELSVRRHDATGGHARLHSRHGLRTGRVTALSSAGGAVELACLDAAHWQTELARAATVIRPTGAPEPPVPWLELPLDTLLAGGEALRAGRDDVLEELVDRAVGPATTPDGPLSRTDLRSQLVRLHQSTIGRLRVSVACSRDGTGRAGWVSWLLVADGWRSLTPVVRQGEPLVRVAAALPQDLGRQVAALVTLVRGRS